MQYVYVDTENVGTSWVSLVDQLEPDTVLLLFYTAQSSGVSLPQLGRLLDFMRRGDIQLINCSVGKNALDFQLVTELGHRIAGNSEAEYIILSSDTGYDVVVNFWRSRGCRIRRVPAGGGLYAAPATQGATNPENKNHSNRRNNRRVVSPVQPEPKADVSRPETVESVVSAPLPVEVPKAPRTELPVISAVQPETSSPTAAQAHAPEAAAPLYGRVTVGKPVEIKAGIPKESKAVTEKEETHRAEPLSGPEKTAAPLYGRIIVSKSAQPEAKQPERAPKADAQPAKQPEAKQPERTPKADAQPAKQPEAKQPERTPKVDAQPAKQPEAKQPERTPKADAKSAPQPEAKQPERAPKGDAKPAPQPEAKQPERAPKADAQPAKQPEAKQPERTPKADAQPAKQPEAKQPERAPKGDAKPAPQPEAKQPERTPKADTQPAKQPEAKQPERAPKADTKPAPQQKEQKQANTLPVETAERDVPMEPAPISPVIRLEAARMRPETVINAVRSAPEAAIMDALKKADEAAQTENILRILNDSLATEPNRRMSWIYRTLLKTYGQKHGVAIYNAIRDKAKLYCRTLEKTANEA